MRHYRDHSFHVHCWTAEEFAGVLLWAICRLGHQWQLVDGYAYEPPIHYEFGYLLRRAERTIDAGLRAQEFERAWQAWRVEQLERRPGLFGDGRPHRVRRFVAHRARTVLRRNPALGRGYRAARRAIARRPRAR